MFYNLLRCLYGQIDAPANAREEKGSCACHLIGGTYDALVRAFGFFA